MPVDYKNQRIRDNLFKFRFLKKTDFEQMFEAFKSAFSDYPVPFNLSKPAFKKKFVDKLNIDFTLSPAFFIYGELAGFIFSSINLYEGMLTAYNGGTGVIEKYRGNRLTTKLYEKSLDDFKSRGIQQCVLEVLTSNTRAINTYKQIGFKKSKDFFCFKLDQSKFRISTLSKRISIIEKETPDWNSYTQFMDHNPSFLDTKEMINHNLKNEKVIEAHINEDELIGYGIYQSVNGRISQIGIKKSERFKGIGSSLISYIYNDSKNKNLSIINIDKTVGGAKIFFSKLGFENQLNQYEMIMSI